MRVCGGPLPGTAQINVNVFCGAHVCKLALMPVSPGLTALTKKPISANSKPHALRQSVIERFGQKGGEWELQVQLNTGLEAMPIEDASVPWPEDKSPYVTAARISVPAQKAWSAEGKAAMDGRYDSFLVAETLAAIFR